MPLSPDDHMIVNHDPEQAPGFGDAPRDVDIGPARLGIAAWMIVDQNHRARADVERLLNHLARMDRGFVDRAVADVVVHDQPIARVHVK